MNKIKAPAPVDGSLYAPDTREPEAYYGLPREVKYCSSCIISNQRPASADEFSHTRGVAKSSMHLDDSGECDACKFARIKNDEIDWDERAQELADLCDRYRRTDGRYDCLVPGSGGKDSIMAAHILKYRYGMHPLTVTWAPHIYTEWGWRNFQAWIHAGFDNHLFTPNARVHRLLTRLALETICHPFQPFMIGQKAFAPKLARQLDIPLVLFGDNPGEHGDALARNFTPIRDVTQYTSRDPESIYLGGTSIEELKANYGLDANDLHPYMPAHPDELAAAKIDVQWLSYYLKWHVQGNYYYAVEHSGFQPAPDRSPGTYSRYNSIDDKMDDLHFYTTYIKFGYGRATQEACFEIRNGDITRNEAINLARRYDGEFPERFFDELLTYLSLPENEFPIAAQMFEQPEIGRSYFSALIDRFRSPHLWKRENGNWKLRHTPWDEN